LLKAYKETRGKDQRLKERFVQFILEYAPPSEWKNFVRHPYQDSFDSFREHNPSHTSEYHDYSFNRNLNEIYPEDLKESEIEKVLGDSYKYRSNFVHRGEQPPYRSTSTLNWFFEQGFVSFHGKWDEKGRRHIKDEKCPLVVEDVVRPKYELLLNIAKVSLINYIDRKLLKA
ncbi:MAG: hypothetical protein WA958_05260, partial [Tunicatimonas sp.]